MFQRDLPGAEGYRGGLLIRLDKQGGIAPGDDGGVLGLVERWPASAQPLGFWHEQPLAMVYEDDDKEWPAAREWFAELPESQFQLIATALQVSAWQSHHRFCGCCGRQAERVSGEFAMQCPACGHRNYPRISPCIITLVTDGEDLLLARSPRFPPGRFSTLAGFIEPGESAEEAVRREVFEEVGLTIERVAYFKSQPWPFPHSLMLGFFAQATDRRIRIDGIEISEAAWFSPRQLPKLPPLYSISRALIETHLEQLK